MASTAKDLIQPLHDAGIGPLDRSVVEQIVARGPECLPPLLDILISDVDDAVLARALALLGEIGGLRAPVGLPLLCERTRRKTWILTSSRPYWTSPRWSEGSPSVTP